MKPATMRATILGSSGGAPSATRETSCVLVREGRHALLLDLGSGVRRILAGTPSLHDIDHVDAVLTHFHFDHVCGLPFLQWLDVDVTLWAPGAWLYDTPSAEILAALRTPPISPNDITSWPLEELREGEQSLSGFTLRAGPQPHHWAPSCGLRVDDELAYVTDTAYEDSSIELARGVRHLLHEAWSTSTAPRHTESHATAADAGRVASGAGVETLTLIHIDPDLDDVAALADDARSQFAVAVVAEDGMELS
ncbi:MAG TPA: MBL fold metallo-hydrolase [Gaiellaceae bacterium]|nr:MBL fold metallo-hydrolase [Gaiellaceae bacterium]